jgi:D-alanyl-D-alanine carboxypeptidase
MPRTTTPDALAASLDRHFARIAHRRARKGLPPAQARVEAPGFLYKSGGDEPFHAASIGKLATTALVAQQIDRGTLALDSRIADLLPAAELDGLFQPSTTDVTIGHLLSHTSGAADYFDERTTHGPNMRTLVITDPDHEWTPSELIAFSRERQKPAGAPGERFHYSDTGFALLGRALEEITGSTFVQLVRRDVFEPSGMNNSVTWQREPGPARIAPLWLNGVEASGFRSISCDWAGGGIVSTPDDMARLGTALSDGTLMSRETWQRLAQPNNRFRRGIHYGHGVMQLRFDGFAPMLRGLPRPIGHLGVLSTHLFFDPANETSIVLNFHDTRQMTASFQTHIRIAQGLARLPEPSSRATAGLASRR